MNKLQPSARISKKPANTSSLTRLSFLDLEMEESHFVCPLRSKLRKLDEFLRLNEQNTACRIGKIPSSPHRFGKCKRPEQLLLTDTEVQTKRRLLINVGPVVGTLLDKNNEIKVGVRAKAENSVEANNSQLGFIRIGYMGLNKSKVEHIVQHVPSNPSTANMMANGV
jgi:hypothetical protein